MTKNEYSKAQIENIQKITQKRFADMRLNFDTFVLTFGVPLIER